MYQRFTHTTAMSDWISHLAAFAQTLFCQGRIKIVFIDNITGHDNNIDHIPRLVEAIKTRCPGCEHVLQDVFHVVNGLISHCNNRSVVDRSVFMCICSLEFRWWFGVCCCCAGRWWIGVCLCCAGWWWWFGGWLFDWWAVVVQRVVVLGGGGLECGCLTFDPVQFSCSSLFWLWACLC